MNPKICSEDRRMATSTQPTRYSITRMKMVTTAAGGIFAQIDKAPVPGDAAPAAIFTIECSGCKSLS